MIDFNPHKKILVAPLNWGLGHAARCIPIIDALQKNGFEPILAGDGMSLSLLRKEYPSLAFYELPSTSVEYAKNGSFLKYKLLSQAPKLIKTIAQEKARVAEIHQKENLAGIISDNRFGLRSEKVPSVYITHQLKVLSGSTSIISTTLHQQLISKFDQCWVPDYSTNELAGDMSKSADKTGFVKYIGPLSRFEKKQMKKKWDLLAVLSGPEPQRSLLEKKLLDKLKLFSGKSLIIRGIIEDKQNSRCIGNMTLVNFMLQNELRDSIESSRLIVSRSGYSNIMDLDALGAKTFFIPTPGQFEQEYLARHFQSRGISDYAEQHLFDVDKLHDGSEYKGFGHKKTPNKDFDKSLFDVFK
ncbi:glycosyltransferase [Lutimonas halocynthiae]|uniref:glycosyltransferase n=1 Tax=Lutimonas halocynthiae TaxID=1446477 RepID=UPI0025B33B54|nr:glycosyltransferase [Lutimonas halocynthiae]MDN3641376.1 glycosyltransferase [Lutimonas halocynthiae]